ncbi:uncharacterized protein MEPE_01391 [Melanopsichium pennsylvanicum]|uniref:Uncharacterized protein n=1 Tax=Melanopsichium pennsylvanicum TaxID=63383 RepID=A0AAJ4XHN7_9BASI|nr:uncharacterized protein MEPE_01391 [Melanopsichium pennsylvanicum]
MDLIPTLCSLQVEIHVKYPKKCQGREKGCSESRSTSCLNGDLRAGLDFFCPGVDQLCFSRPSLVNGKRLFRLPLACIGSPNEPLPAITAVFDRIFSGVASRRPDICRVLMFILSLEYLFSCSNPNFGGRCAGCHNPTGLFHLQRNDRKYHFLCDQHTHHARDAKKARACFDTNLKLSKYLSAPNPEKLHGYVDASETNFVLFVGQKVTLLRTLEIFVQQAKHKNHREMGRSQ